MIRKYLFLWGAEEDPEGEGEDEGGEGQEPNPTAVPSTRELTAEEIEKMTARVADRSARKARKELAGEFGFDDLSKMKEWVEARQTAEKEQMDEKDRAIREAEEAKLEAQTLRANLVSDRLDLAVRSQVISSGITDKKKSDRVTALVRLDLDADLVNEDEDTWEEAITAALTAVKEDAPELFAGSKAAGFGSGDGGPRGSSTPEGDKTAEQEKKLKDEFAGRGYVSYEAP